MIDKVKLMAMYLPQYHEIPENNEFWGKGFTDWTTVKSAKQYFKDVVQPKVPLNDNYYDLSKMETLEWQVKLAKEYGIDGFCFYHYWFSSDKQLLQTPAENFLKNKELDIDFCFAWDNAPWKRTWSTQFGNDWAPIFDKKLDTENESSLLINFDYGTEKDWEKHFNYLLPFFLDNRYLKKDNKPVFIMWNKNEPDKVRNMILFWNEKAKLNGFDGVYFIGKYSPNNNIDLFDGEFFYEPGLDGWENNSFFSKFFVKIQSCLSLNTKPKVYSYKRVWKSLIRRISNVADKAIYYGAFINYDDTPRRGQNGRLLRGGNPKRFKEFLKKVLTISSSHKKEFVFITAWNEWGEGANLEPDNVNCFEYLKKIKEIKG